MNSLGFLQQFLRNPLQTGAVVASGSRLCQLLVKTAQVSKAQVILEFGTGTGAVTEEICRQKASHASLIGFEINQAFAEATRKRCPDADIVNLCATAAEATLWDRQLYYCDCIISGLPWATLSGELQNNLLQAAFDTLKPGGVFVTFAYLHSLPLMSAQRFHGKLSQTFQHVQRSPVIWNNVPPALAYIAVK